MFGLEWALEGQENQKQTRMLWEMLENHFDFLLLAFLYFLITGGNQIEGFITWLSRGITWKTTEKNLSMNV